MKTAEGRGTALYVLGFYLALLALWQGLYSFGAIPDYLFPSPLQVSRRLRELSTDGLLWPSVRATFSVRGETCSKATRMVRTAKAADTANCASTTLGT